MIKFAVIFCLGNALGNAIWFLGVRRLPEQMWEITSIETLAIGFFVLHYYWWGYRLWEK